MPQVKARSAGQTVAADQLLYTTNPRRLEEYRNQMMAASCSAAAQTVTQAAASLQLDLRSLGKRTTRVTRGAEDPGQTAKKGSRLQSLVEASGPPVPPISQPETVSGKRKQGGVDVSKQCGACGLHKSKETRSNTSCPTHCRECKAEWQDPEQRTCCSCRI